MVLKKKNSSPLTKYRNTFVNKNLQNLKMYIQKYRQSKSSLWEMFKKLSLLFIRIVHKHWVVFFFLLLNIILYFLLYFNTLCTDPEIKLWKRFRDDRILFIIKTSLTLTRESNYVSMNAFRLGGNQSTQGKNPYRQEHKHIKTLHWESNWGPFCCG